MENSISRILIETTVRQTLRGLKENPKRSTRNLVDMALHFSEGRFQNHFFQTAHTMLEHEESAYYALIEDAVSHIETEHLVTFGMNLGYAVPFDHPMAACFTNVLLLCGDRSYKKTPPAHTPSFFPAPSLFSQVNNLENHAFELV